MDYREKQATLSKVRSLSDDDLMGQLALVEDHTRYGVDNDSRLVFWRDAMQDEAVRRGLR